MAQKRYMVLGPKNLGSPYKSPALYGSMQFKAGGYGAPPLPIHIECPDYTFAAFVFDRLQPFFSVRSNWIPAPRVLVQNFISAPGFQEVADAVEQRAIASVDNSKTNSDGHLFQEAFAFLSFSEAIKCQMLNDTPRTALHVYNPLSQPESSAALRRSLLEEGVKEEVPEERVPSPDPPSDPETPQLRSSRQRPFAPSTPCRPAHVANAQGTPGSYYILFSPNVELRINSPNPESPGPASPAQRARAARAKGIDFGRRMLANEGLSSEDIADIEEVLLGAYSAEMFIEAVGKEESRDALTSEKAQLLSTMARQKKASNFDKLLHASRRPWRIRAKRIGIKLTAGQKAEKNKQRAAQKESYKEALLEVHQQIYAAAAEIHERFIHIPTELIATDIFQSERLQASTKNVGRYNAFVSLQSKLMNAEVPEGQPRQKVNELSKKIAKMWEVMSEEEKDAATREELAHLRDRRANKEVGEHRVSATAAQDSVLTLQRVQETLQRLTMRTGDEHLLITTRGSNKVYHKPFVFASSNRVVEFFSNAYKEIPADMGYRMDAFMVSGVEGLARTHVQILAQMKKDIAGLIFRKLQESVSNVKVGRMTYLGFEEQITKRFGVIVKNWPLQEFKNPSCVSTKSELELLWHAWDSGAAHFYRMTTQEYSDWLAIASGPVVIQSGEDGQEGGDGSSNGEAATGGQAVPDEGLSSMSGSGIQVPSGVSPSPTSGLAPPSNFVAMNMVTDASGDAVAVQKRGPRKKRSDAGRPRKRKVGAASNEAA
ncbi:hypothetical protein BT96DRAFT_935467 [Gymnopus androsaceus JB14]|uniref:Uncharacterized protein n=1 Tax=Gymnopus androsaceus JB14 TaxID=1447944 RepID=A0A6A4I2P0_9AGAR|nr:hypothetical protein BT96DRAFT_935467 [Gymnopus androsaceus JB14]